VSKKFRLVLNFKKKKQKHFSSNPEPENLAADNVRLLIIPVEVSVQLKVHGASKPDIVNYKRADRREMMTATFDDDIGPLVTHVYEVANEGSANLA
jgi:hypothetical protein